MNKRETALVVDDDYDIENSYMRFLKHKGFDVIGAGSYEEALNYLNRNFDLILLDGLNGKCFELEPKLKAKRKIIMTGDDEILRIAIEHGLEAYSKHHGIKQITEKKNKK